MTIVYKANRIEGLSSDTKPADQYNGRIFYETDTSKSFSFDGSTWNEIGSSSEINTFTSESTFTPSSQSGNTLITIDSTDSTAGQIDVNVDGSLSYSVQPAGVSTRIVNPSSSLSIVAAGKFTGKITNIQTATMGKDIPITSGYKAVNNPCFSSDGTRIYCWQEYVNNVYGIRQFNLSTAWDLSTFSNGGYKAISLSNSGDQGGCVQISDDNMYLFFKHEYAGGNNAKIHRYPFSTAKTISTLSATPDQTFTPSEITGAYIQYNMIYMTPDGKNVLYFNDQERKIYHYTMSTAYDLSTMSFVRSKATNTLTSIGTNIMYCFANNAMTKIGIGDYTSNASTSRWVVFDITANDISTINDTNVEIGASGSLAYQFGTRFGIALSHDQKRECHNFSYHMRSGLVSESFTGTSRVSVV
jgi:hypothetical protein